MVKAMKRHIRVARVRTMRSNFMRGLSSLLTIADEPRPRHSREPMACLRDDFAKIGADMYVAVERETAHEEARRKAIPAAE